MRTIIISVFLAAAAAAQNPTPTLNCGDRSRSGEQFRTCEMREQTMPYGGLLNIDGGQNGGVSVHGWNRAEVLVRAKVEARAESDAEAKSLAQQVRLNASAGKVSASGPAMERGRNWSVSYEVFAPAQSNLEISAHNGGVSISGIRGNATFNTVNGGIHLTDVNGSFKGKTTNGGVHVQLAGSRWDGAGLDVSTTNGGISIGVPSNYSAELEASTVNGGLRSDFGMTAEASRDNRLRANLGSGGAPIRLATRNGGIKVSRN